MHFTNNYSQDFPTPGHITSDFIPHSEFHKGSWLISVNHPGWYYFLKKKDNNMITDPDFMNSVDEPLKKLVSFLHDKNIYTTPSCAGHYKSKQTLSEIYDSLLIEKEKIAGEGLKLKNVETGKIYLYRDKNYLIPRDRDKFIMDLESYQHHGIIGIRLNNYPRLKNQILKLVIEGVEIYEEDQIVFISTNEQNKNDNDYVWKKVTKEIINIFEKVSVVTGDNSALQDDR